MRYELNFDEDKVNDVLVVGGASYDLKGCCELLNEQQATISALNEENEQLRNELDKYKIVILQFVGLLVENGIIDSSVKEEVDELLEELSGDGV